MTLLFHCDESYDRHHHVHLGVVSTGAQAAAAEKDVRALTSSLMWDRSINCRELHGQRILGNGAEWADVDIDTRIDVYREALEIIPDNGLEVLYRGIDFDAYCKKYTASRDPRGDTFEFMFSDLLNKHLLRRCRDVDDYALVITDNNSQYADKLRYAHSVTRAAVGYKSDSHGIVDTCHFVDSAHSPLVQLADLAAYVRRRRITTPTEGDARAEKAMQQLNGIVSAAIPEPSYNYCSVHRYFS